MKMILIHGVRNFYRAMDDLRLKVTKIISRGMEDTRTVVESYKTRCAMDLNTVLDNTTDEILKIIEDENTRKFSRNIN